MRHVIRKQMISLQLTAGYDAFAVQQQAKGYFYDHVVPALEKVLDELSSPNEMIAFDRLEIDLGDLTWRNEQLVVDSDHIYRVLKQSFSEVIASTKVQKSHNITFTSIEKHACLQWIYYMENGVLPWTLQQTQAVWLEQVIHQLAVDHALIEKVKELIRHHRWFLSRVVRDHTEVFLKQLASVMAAKPQPELVQVINDIVQQTGSTSLTRRRTTHALWSAALLQFAEGKTSYEPEEALLNVARAYEPTESSTDSPPLLQEGIFCSLAGIVLLHPFFRHLFNHLSLLEEGQFIDDVARQKAALLIYYAATGQTDVKDYELVASKTLCGLSLDQVLDETAYQLTEAEKQETQNMIQAAIEQWSIMKNTSVEALREGFLQREGKLVREQNAISFRVETSGIDVLLDHLPWNLSIVKFSWLEQLIRVEWR